MDISTFRENGKKPVRVTAKGEVFIGEDEFPYPIVEDSVKVERLHKRNLLTITLFVGDVSIEARKSTAVCKQCGISVYGRQTKGCPCPNCGTELI